jgi:hypothetical protein
MADTRTRIRRTIELLGLLGAAATCFVTGKFGLMVADAAPVSSLAEPLKPLPLMTVQALAWKQYFPTIGLTLAVAVILAAGIVFASSKDEDTRLQATLAICLLGYAASITMWGFVGVNLIVLPHAAHVI